MATWAGSVPAATGVAPQVRFGRKWFNLLWLLPLGFVLLLVAVAVAKDLRQMPVMAEFIARYSGTATTDLPDTVGIPVWARSPPAVLDPALHPGPRLVARAETGPPDPLWTAKQDSISLPRQVGLPGLRHSIGLARWWHLGVDVLWLLNGLAFYILLFATGHWHRLVPTSAKVFPSATSMLIQYLSLDWPHDNGWAAYNGLQLIAYFITVFIAAPLTLLTGLGMSPVLSTRLTPISSVLNIQAVLSLHFLVWVWFVGFIAIHVALVATTGVLANLNHITTGRDDSSWLGFWLFTAWMGMVVIGWVAATPLTLHRPRLIQRVGAALLGPIQRLFEHLDPKPGRYTADDISPYLWHNGRYPHSTEYDHLREAGFADYTLHITRLVNHPLELSLEQLRRLPSHEQITPAAPCSAPHYHPPLGPPLCRGRRYCARPSPTGMSTDQHDHHPTASGGQEAALLHSCRRRTTTRESRVHRSAARRKRLTR